MPKANGESKKNRTPAPRLNFSKKLLETWPAPPLGRVYLHDERARGLVLAITSAGAKTFYLYRKVKGRPERVKIGPFPDLSVEQARGKAAELNAAIAKGDNPAEWRRSARAEMTLEQLFTAWLERYGKVHRKTWPEDKRTFGIYVTGALKGRKLSAIRRIDLAALHVKVGEEHGKIVANRLLSLLRAVFNRALDWGVELALNPATRIRKFPEQARERFLQADELPKFFQALAEEPNETARDFFLLALLTGARKGNLVGMTWAEVNLGRATWTIPETKAGHPQTVALVPEAVTILSRRRAEAVDSPFVFASWGATRHYIEPKSAWKRILARAGIADLRLHDLRRTLGSWQAAQGASLTIIGKSLGHRNVSTTAIYARLNLDPVRRSVEAATRAMLVAGGQLPEAEVVGINEVKG
jgi:integrase